MPHLLLVRHGESEYNANNMFTGLKDIPLTEKGRQQAAVMAGAIKDLKPDGAYTSSLSRAQETLKIITKTNDWDYVPIVANPALNERDYGELTGKNKQQTEEQLGHEAFIKMRRGWDQPIPNGETLRMVYRRAVLYFTEEILPNIRHGHNILIVAHGNTLRALIKHLDNLNDGEVENLEMPLVEIVVYDYEVRIASKQVRKFQSNLPFVTVNSTYLKD